MAEKTEITIRPACNEDIPAVERIAVRAWTPYFAYRRQQLGEELFEIAHHDWQADKARQVRENCQERNGCRAYVAMSGDQLVGFVTFFADQERGLAEIGNNAVDPDQQGQGIGAQMYEFAFERMRALGMTHVRVRTGGDPAHGPARRAYEKVGFGQAIPHVEYHRKL